jgi:hypothetical protein
MDPYSAHLVLTPEQGINRPNMQVVVLVRRKAHFADGKALWEAEALVVDDGGGRQQGFTELADDARAAVRGAIVRMNDALHGQMKPVAVPDVMRRRNDAGDVEELAEYARR